MKEYQLSDRLLNTLARDYTKVSLGYVELRDGSAVCLAEVTVEREYCRHTFEVECGKPQSVAEVENNLVEAVDKYVGDETHLADRIADQYFRDNLDCISIREAIDYGEVIKEALVDLKMVLESYLKAA
jgi:hypothetical protein